MDKSHRERPGIWWGRRPCQGEGAGLGTERVPGKGCQPRNGCRDLSRKVSQIDTHVRHKKPVVHFITVQCFRKINIIEYQTVRDSTLCGRVQSSRGLPPHLGGAAGQPHARCDQRPLGAGETGEEGSGVPTSLQGSYRFPCPTSTYNYGTVTSSDVLSTDLRFVLQLETDSSNTPKKTCAKPTRVTPGSAAAGAAGVTQGPGNVCSEARSLPCPRSSKDTACDRVKVLSRRSNRVASVGEDARSRRRSARSRSQDGRVGQKRKGSQLQGHLRRETC